MSLPALVSEPATALLPEGVVVTPLVAHADDRGRFTEIFRASWPTDVEPLQWNIVSSVAGVLRGVHVHRRHADYLTVASGRLTLGLADLRGGAPANACCIRLDAENPAAVTIPPGVAHGFFFPEPTVHVYAVSRYFDSSDELGCRWDDPDLAIPWQVSAPSLSPRDVALPALAGLLCELREARRSARAGRDSPPGE